MNESTQTWSHGGSQAGWRKVKPSVEVEPRALTGLDMLCAVSGLLVIVVSFFVYYTHTLSQRFGVARRVSGAWVGWHTPAGEVSVVLAGAASLLFLIVGIAMAHSHSLALRTWVCGLFAGSAVAAVVAFFWHPTFRFADIDGQFEHAVEHGNGYGYWASVLLILAGLIASVLRLRDVRREVSAARSEGARHSRS